MKVLIITSGRSGSTSLALGLSNSINGCDLFFEPFASFNHNNNELIRNDLGTPTSIKKHVFYLRNSDYNVIEKHIIDDPYYWGDNKEVSRKDCCVDFYLNYSKCFDKIILLDRRKLEDWVDSWVNAREKNEFFKYEEKKIKDVDYKEELKQYGELKEMLYIISDKLKIPVYYYEDIFSGDKNYIKEFLDKLEIKIDSFEKLYDKLKPI